MSAPKYASFTTSEKGYHPRAIAYGLKAFDLGGHGTFVHADVKPSDSVNVTAYAVAGKDGALWVTVINKELEKAATVTVSPGAGYSKAQMMLLEAPKDDTSVKEGILVGDGSIDDAARFDGKWSEIPVADGSVKLELSPATAAIVKMTR